MIILISLGCSSRYRRRTSGDAFLKFVMIEVLELSCKNVRCLCVIMIDCFVFTLRGFRVDVYCYRAGVVLLLCAYPWIRGVLGQGPRGAGVQPIQVAAVSNRRRARQRGTGHRGWGGGLGVLGLTKHVIVVRL